MAGGDIAVVMPARDMGATIAASLASVLAAPEVAEVIVVDNGSTDDTAARARGLGDPRVRVLAHGAPGVAGSLNAGFDAVTRPFVARCDADDLYPEGRLAAQRNWLLAHADYAAVSGAHTSITASGRPVTRLAGDGAAGEVTETLRGGRCLTHFCTFLTRIEAIRAVGGARPWFETAEDVDLQLRLAEVGRIWHDPDRDAYLYRLHGGSITHNQAEPRRLFFDRAAQDFAAERRATGQDALMRGTPPPPPPRDAPGAARSPRRQIAGQLESAAWTALRGNRRGQAVAAMARALAQEPFALRRWRGAAALMAKSLRPPRG